LGVDVSFGWPAGIERDLVNTLWLVGASRATWREGNIVLFQSPGGELLPPDELHSRVTSQSSSQLLVQILFGLFIMSKQVIRLYNLRIPVNWTFGAAKLEPTIHHTAGTRRLRQSLGRPREGEGDELGLESVGWNRRKFAPPIGGSLAKF